MEMNKYSILRWFIIAICALPLMSAGCEKDNDDTGGGSSNTPTLSNYLRVKNASAHYVGTIVVIDFEVENRSGRDVNDIEFDGRTMIYDQGGNSFYGVSLSAGEGQNWSWPSISGISLNKGETRKFRMRVDDSKVAQIVTSLKLSLEGMSRQLGITDFQEIPFEVRVTDSRKTSNAVWTNDDKMSYGHPICRRDGDKLYATFTITNRTGVDLRNVEVHDYGLSNGNGSSFGMHFGIDGNFSWMSKTFNINNGETINLTVMAENFYTLTPRNIDAKIGMKADNYTFACDNLYLTTISLN